jgi:hypothetical protein
MDSKLIQQLEQTLERKVEWIKPEIKGFSGAQIQEYLIPICMQLADLDEPSDPHSLNLLPLGLVEKYKRAKLGLQIWSLTLTITLFVWVSFLITIGSYLFMTQKVRDMKAKLASKAEVAKLREEATEEVKNINDVAERVSKIKSASAFPQKVLNDIGQSRPWGITITQYKLNLDKGKIELKGIASNRQVLLEFKKNLEETPDAVSVEIPISSFEVESNLEFKLAYDYLPITGTGDGDKPTE